MTNTPAPVPAIKPSRHRVILGAQWGDEGKGKIVDCLCDEAEGVVRYQGGHNAGHTIQVRDKTFALQLLPSGALREGVHCYIGNGVVLSLNQLVREMDAFAAQGIDLSKRLHVSLACPLLFPFHAAVDSAREASAGAQRIGTTGKGIGPAYEDKTARRALRLGDLRQSARFAERFLELAEYHNFLLREQLGAPALPPQALLDETLLLAERILPLAGDIGLMLYEADRRGERLLFEGAQGTLLDLDHGTYPFVTSSNTVAGNAAAGSGIGPNLLHEIWGVSKAYCTRVGGGPFPTELDIVQPQSPGQHLSRVGRERGTVTGRPRRCGWLDLPALRRACIVNGLSALCITKLDVLDGLPEIKLCQAYRLDGREISILPQCTDEVARCEPIYESFPGWRETTSGVTRFEALPQAAQKFLQHIQAALQVPLKTVSTGPEREQTIHC